jgi:thymidylate synthase (FAD)
VPEIVPLQVQVIAQTQFTPPADVPWETDVDGGQALAEFAGRACYQSWDKPNPATATNSGYLRHILEVGHLSVLEHGTVTMYLTGLSRSLTHELIRHRHFSYSQLSQRYVPERDAAFVEPAVIAEDPELHERFLAATDAALAAYGELLEGLEKRFADVPNATLRRKQARQAARSVLPNATETRIVVTAPGGTSSPCGPASTPTSRSASSPSHACGSCSGWPGTSSTTSGSARWPTARRSPPARS